MYIKPVGKLCGQEPGQMGIDNAVFLITVKHTGKLITDY